MRRLEQWHSQVGEHFHCGPRSRLDRAVFAVATAHATAVGIVLIVVVVVVVINFVVVDGERLTQRDNERRTIGYSKKKTTRR